MCSRYVLKSKPADISSLFKTEKALDWKPRYNIAPSQKIPAFVRTLDHKAHEFKLLQWGFFAPWAQGGRLLVNVQSEEIREKPIFAEFFEKWRCLIPADGFYEWRHQAKETRPFYFQMADERPFAFAGIWSQQKVEGETVEVCAILTTQPNETVRAVHDRMPVILDPKDFDLWLNSEDVRDFERIERLFQPFSAGRMKSHAVGSIVNKMGHEGPDCIKPANEPETLSFPF